MAALRIPRVAQLIHRPLITRTFSTSRIMSAQREWLVTIPDHPNALDKRMAARPAHLNNLKPRIDAGQVVFGGAMLAKQPAEGESPQMVGSVMLVKADSEEEVRKLLEGDEYTKGGAWDVAKATIQPFKCAVRTAL